jgi:aminopeptidase N
MVLAVTLALATSGAAADTYPRQLNVDAVHYTFRVTVLPGQSEKIDGHTTILLRAVSGDVREVQLDLASAAAGKGMAVASVTYGSQSLPFVHEKDRLRVTLAEPVRTGGDITFSVQYSGTPASGLTFVKNAHGEPTAFSDNWPHKIRQWLPMIDHPYDKATGEFIVTAPSTFQVVANGLMIEEVDLADGLRRTHWKQSVPIASWLFALGIARFTSHHAGVVQNVPLQTWVFPQDRDAGYSLFEGLSRRVMNYFSEHIGPYPYEKLANVQAAGQDGGMENATVIFYGENGVSRGRAPVVHEIAHQWFGDSVTERDWDDVWLSEGFATYFTSLFTEHDEGRDAFVDSMRRSRQTVLQLGRKLPDTPVIHRNLADMERVLNQLVYQKGGWTLHMLRFFIGDDAFWMGIREYYRRYRDQNASTAEFRAIMEDAADVNLQWFFDQWLTRPGVPRVEGEWYYDAAKKTIEITIRQTQPQDPFRISFHVGVIERPGGVPRLERTGTDRRTEHYSIKADAEPVDVVLDPGVWLLYEPGPFVKKQ